MTATADRLARIGRLRFLDFIHLDPLTARAVVNDPDARSLLGPALSNSPAVLVAFRRACPDLAEDLMTLANSAATVPEAHAARDALVHRFALELLREKAPPLYDALPWHDWDVGDLTRRFPPWKTKFLLSGEGATVASAKLRRTAGLLVVEPVPSVARYVRLKAEKEKVRRLRVVEATLAESGLEDNSHDVAVVGLPVPGGLDPAFDLLARACRSMLMLCLRPDAQFPGDDWFARRGFKPGRVAIASGGDRPAWWRFPDG